MIHAVRRPDPPCEGSLRPAGEEAARRRRPCPPSCPNETMEKPTHVLSKARGEEVLVAVADYEGLELPFDYSRVQRTINFCFDGKVCDPSHCTVCSFRKAAGLPFSESWSYSILYR